MTFHDSIPVWIDCDPGTDDTFAILLALYHKRFNVLGISTVHGNVLLDSTTHNALGLLELLNIPYDSVKVYAGSDRPLVKPPREAKDIHGPTGLGDIDLPVNPHHKPANDMDYIEAIKQAIENYPDELCLVCTGPLTNIVRVFKKYPDLKEKVKLISIMGGGKGIGNVTPFAEFNFYCDPHAASFVVSDPVLSNKIVLAPLNITHKAIATKEIQRKVYNEELENSMLRLTFYKILMFFAKSYAGRPEFIEGPPVHDPLAVFLLLPMLEGSNKYDFKYLRRKIDVITEGEKEGSVIFTNTNLADGINEKDGVYIGLDINVKEFWDYVLDSLALADTHK